MELCYSIVMRPVIRMRMKIKSMICNAEIAQKNGNKYHKDYNTLQKANNFTIVKIIVLILRKNLEKGGTFENNNWRHFWRWGEINWNE